jgi:tRNA A37 threonylcarbamoyladenosine synthetase subunit TsaC/SUA5/YrdC
MASDFSIRHAAHIIRHGGVIAYPTDTIYGLGCDPYNLQAVESINRIKQRPLEKQFITIRISNHQDVQKLCKALGHAIISTSANISGKKPAANALDLHKYFHRTVDKILISGQKQTNKPSKIIRLCDNHVIRH